MPHVIFDIFSITRGLNPGLLKKYCKNLPGKQEMSNTNPLILLTIIH